MTDCAACQAKRCHTAEEWANHPLAGHGFTPETGWTHPEAQRSHEAEVEAAKRYAQETKTNAAEKKEPKQ